MPKTIYATPDSWGNKTEYHDFDGMQTVIDSLIDDCGEDFANISIDDCDQLKLEEVIDDNTASYHRRGETDIVLRKSSQGFTRMYELE